MNIIKIYTLLSWYWCFLFEVSELSTSANCPIACDKKKLPEDVSGKL